MAFEKFLEAALGPRGGWRVSVFTPAYRPGAKIRRPYESLLAQTFKDWELVVVDDSDDDGATFRELSALAERVEEVFRDSGTEYS
jgi:glycosyltransferase involved in cell wall biosynthesis